MSDWTTMISAGELATLLGQPGLALVDCRHSLADPGAGEAAWRTGHLPGAGHAHLDRDLSNHRKPQAQGRHPLPDAADFNETLVRLGISPGVQVVAYDAADGSMAAARFWWLLRSMGHRRVAVLDGGLSAWYALGLPLDTTPPQIAPGHFDGSFDPHCFASTHEVEARLAEAPGWLLDARAPERFRGEVEPLDPVAGHIPGALNRPLSANLQDGRMKSATALRAEFLALISGRAPADLVMSCGSGVTACHNLLALAHAGLEGARLYPASWSGWVSDPARAASRLTS